MIIYIIITSILILVNITYNKQITALNVVGAIIWPIGLTIMYFKMIDKDTEDQQNTDYHKRYHK